MGLLKIINDILEIINDILLFLLLFPGCYILLLILIHKILTTFAIIWHLSTSIFWFATVWTSYFCFCRLATISSSASGLSAAVWAFHTRTVHLLFWSISTGSAAGRHRGFATRHLIYIFYKKLYINIFTKVLMFFACFLSFTHSFSSSVHFPFARDAFSGSLY